MKPDKMEQMGIEDQEITYGKDIKSLTLSQLQEEMVALGEQKFRAKQM